MYIFFHLFAGLVIGFLIADLLHDRRWLLPCALGSVLPDFIDKPIGHILFADSIGYGRIYGHTLLFFLCVLIAGLILWKYRKTPVLVALATGILLHEILDLMWREPANWCYPFLGPFQGHLPADYMATLISEELSNPFEIAVALVLVAGVILSLAFRQNIRDHAGYREILRGVLLLSSFSLLALGGIILGKAMVGQTLPIPGWSMHEEYIIGGILLVLAAYDAWQIHRNLEKYAGPGA